MAKIYMITASTRKGDWSAVYDDSDSMTDYYHAITGNQRHMAYKLLEDGDTIVRVDMQNGKEQPLKMIYYAVKRIARRAGYTVEFKEENKTGWDNHQWTEHFAILTRNETERG